MTKLSDGQVHMTTRARLALDDLLPAVRRTLATAKLPGMVDLKHVLDKREVRLLIVGERTYQQMAAAIVVLEEEGCA